MAMGKDGWMAEFHGIVLWRRVQRDPTGQHYFNYGAIHIEKSEGSDGDNPLLQAVGSLQQRRCDISVLHRKCHELGAAEDYLC